MFMAISTMRTTRDKENDYEKSISFSADCRYAPGCRL